MYITNLINDITLVGVPNRNNLKSDRTRSLVFNYPILESSIPASNYTKHSSSEHHTKVCDGNPGFGKDLDYSGEDVLYFGTVRKLSISESRSVRFRFGIFLWVEFFIWYIYIIYVIIWISVINLLEQG